MAYFKSLPALAAVASLASAVPAHAQVLALETQDVLPVAAATQTPDIIEAITSVNFVAESTTVVASEIIALEPVDVVPADVSTTAALLAQPVVPLAFQTTADTLSNFDDAGLQTALNGAAPEVSPAQGEGLDVAQSRRRPYASVSPAYLGVAGNAGFGNPSSAIGDFGVNVISKISLGPRFALRPGFIFSERFTSATVPLTYNFNTLSARGVRFQPYVGAGVDVPFNGTTALMLNAGADVPISRAFTLNAATNVRVTSGFGMGFSLGVGYNLPFVFQ